MDARAPNFYLDYKSDLVDRIEIFANIDGAEALWRKAEAELVASPYQSLAWYSAWSACVGARKGEKPLIVAVFGPKSELLAFWPLITRRVFGRVICEFAGKRHSNANLGFFTPEFAAKANARTIGDILSAVASYTGAIDVFSFRNVPLVWRGEKTWAHLLRGQPSPSWLHATSTAMPFAKWRDTHLSPKRRKRLRYNFRHLNRIGPTRLVFGSDGRNVERILVATFIQKQKRFEFLGIDNPFAAQGVQDFITLGASKESSLDSKPAIELFALDVGGKIVATLGAAVSGKTSSAMFLSFEDTPEFRAASPGDLLVALAIERFCNLGFEYFDLGVGEASYKDRYCSDAAPLRDIFLGVTPAGIAIAYGLTLMTAVKRNLKKLGLHHRLARLAALLRKPLSSQQTER